MDTPPSQNIAILQCCLEIGFSQSKMLRYFVNQPGAEIRHPVSQQVEAIESPIVGFSGCRDVGFALGNFFLRIEQGIPATYELAGSLGMGVAHFLGMCPIFFNDGLEFGQRVCQFVCRPAIRRPDLGIKKFDPFLLPGTVVFIPHDGELLFGFLKIVTYVASLIRSGKIRIPVAGDTLEFWHDELHPG